MPENENRREVLSAIALFLLFIVGIGSLVAPVLLLNAGATQIDSSPLTIPASLSAIASAYSFGQLVSALRPSK